MTRLTIGQREAFLRDLTELTRKHGIAIAGCGCCGSPRLEGVDAREGDGGGYIDHPVGKMAEIEYSTAEERGFACGAPPYPTAEYR